MFPVSGVDRTDGPQLCRYHLSKPRVGFDFFRDRDVIKRIPFFKLSPGMFVSDFHAPLDEHPFFSRPRKIREPREIAFIARYGISEVDIDTDRGLDVSETVTVETVPRVEAVAPPERSAPPKATVQRPVGGESLNREIVRAEKVKNKARKLVGRVLNDARIGRQIEIGPVRDAIVEMTDSMFRNPDAMLTLSQLKDRDEYTFMHSVNVGVFMISFCQSVGMCGDDIIEVGTGAILHDIGKMRVPREVLNKPGRLTDAEFALIREHVALGEQSLADSPDISRIALDVVGQHHERMDGTGYANGASGEGITTHGRMAAIVDVYDAITSDRCYHKGMTAHTALKKMMEWSTTHFDPGLFQQFVKSVGIYPIGTLVRMENHLLGVVLEPNREEPLYPVVAVVFDTVSRKRLSPVRVVNLKIRSKLEPGYRIKGQESADKWRIDPALFVPRPKKAA